MLFSGKENVFMCLVAFQKIFRKIFSGVWKRRRKRQTQKNTDKTQEKNHQRSTLDWVRQRGALRAPVRRSRRRSRSKIAINGAIVISPSSRSTARSREGEIAIDGSSSRISRSSSTDLPLGSLGLHTTCRDLGSSSLDRKSVV